MRTTLFIITALAIAYQTAIHMIIFVCGRTGYDMRPANLLTLIGAALLLLSAVVPWRVRWFRSVALLGCVLPWLYLGPGIFHYFQAISRGDDYFDILILLPSLFLLASGIYVVRAFRSPPITRTTPPTTRTPPQNYDPEKF